MAMKAFQDVLPEIRATCMEELAAWIRLYSSMFMADNYLKYMGWTLHDKVADVRLRCVVGLQGVYGDPLLLPKLDLFTARFKKRLISMTMDKDHEVAVQTVKLLILISQSRSQDVLMTEDYEQMFNLVYSSQRPLAAAAGELLYTRVLSSPASLTPDPQDPGRANEEESNTQLTSARLKALLSFHKDNIHHQHIVYLVDSLWDCAGDLLKDWPSLTAVLLEDPVTQETEAESSTLQQVVPQTATPGLSEEVHQTATPGLSEEVPRTSTPEVPQTAPPSGLTEDERALVVELMVASVRQAAEGCALPGRSSGKKSQPQPVSGYEKRIKEEDCCRLTEFFLQALPRLLSKFFNSPDSLACLMKIPQYFYAAPSSDTSGEVLSDLLAEMEVVVERYADPEVLDEAARSYLTLCGETTPWRVLALPARDNLVRLWTGRLAAWLGGAQEGGLSTADEEKTAEILDTLRKLTIFYSGHDLSSWGLYEKLCPLLSIDSTPEVPAQVIVDVLQCVSYSLLWNLNTSEETITCRAEAVAQRSKLGVFCERCLRCLSHEDELVKEQAFLSLCDVLTAHSYQGYPCLPYAPAPELRRALLVFIEEHVFTPSEHSGDDMEGLEVLHRRRNSLAAFCKLIVHGVLEMSMAAEVFKYYTKYYTDYGDIIKETLSKTRQMDKMESARTLMLCLQNLFLELKGWQDSVEPSGSFEGQTFPAIKELARRFSLTFGWEQSKSRQSLTMIHRDGIEFVFKDFVQNPEEHWLSPPNLRYLTILSEFSSKLLRPDKKTVETYLQRYVGEQVSTAGDDWQPLRYYEGSLLAFRDGDDAPYVISDKEQSYRSQTSTIGRPRKQPASSSEGRKAEASSNASQEVDVATAEVGAVEVGVAAVGAAEVGAPEVGAMEVDAVEANVPEVDAAVVEAPEVDTAEVVAAEAVPAEVIATEVVAAEVVGPEVVAAEVVAAEVVAAEVVAAEVVAAEVVGPEVVGPEVGAAEVGTLEVDTMEVDTVGVETVQVDL